MPADPKKLVILQSRRTVLISILPVLVGLPAVIDLFRHYSQIHLYWVIGAYVVLVLAAGWDRLRKSENRHYVVFDESGINVSTRPGGTIPWSYVEACACKHERGRRILRIFSRAQTLQALRTGQRRSATPAEAAQRLALQIRLQPLSAHFDIDFALAENPDQSLDAAFPACVGWIAARRDPSAKSLPIRDFGDDRPRSRILVPLLLTALLVAVGGVALAMHRSVIEEPPGVLDDRPGQSVLFLGNSRIAVHNLPKVVRDVADSAHSPIRYDVQMRAWGGATLKEHWRDDGDQKALRDFNGVLILQPQSGAFGDESSVRDFDDYGQKLIRAAQDKGARAALISNWTLGPNYFNGEEQRLDGDPKSYGDLTDARTRGLAESSGAGVIELERAFADAQDSLSEVALTADGNHPTAAGTYLAALVIYRYLSHDDLAHVSWLPFDMSEETAAELKRIAMRYGD